MQAVSRLALTALSTLALLGAATVQAQNYPNKPVRLIVPFAPGGASDIIARGMNEPMNRALGQPMIIENKPGAGSSLGVEQAAKSAPDGYTLLIASQSGIIVNPIVNPNVGYVVERDLIPVFHLTRSPLVLGVHPAVPVRSVKELVALAKKSPGKLNYATSGNGSVPHLATIIFSGMTGTDMVHVPYKSGGLAVTSVMAGDTQLTFGTSPSVMPQVVNNKLRGVAVTTKARSPLVPDLPGMEESGFPAFDLSVWYGLFLPAKTPPAIVNRVFTAAQQTIGDARFKDIMAKDGTELPGSKSPEEFANLIREEARVTAKAIKESGVKFD
jgi:tripartite-type tricarboxylate transporter receptor subunit TctC